MVSIAALILGLAVQTATTVLELHVGSCAKDPTATGWSWSAVETAAAVGRDGVTSGQIWRHEGKDGSQVCVTASGLDDGDALQLLPCNASNGKQIWTSANGTVVLGSNKEVSKL